MTVTANRIEIGSTVYRGGKLRVGTGRARGIVVAVQTHGLVEGFPEQLIVPVVTVRWEKTATAVGRRAVGHAITTKVKANTLLDADGYRLAWKRNLLARWAVMVQDGTVVYRTSRHETEEAARTALAAVQPGKTAYVTRELV